MRDRIIFWGLCAVLVLLPLPFGATEKWAIFIFEGTAFILLALHLTGQGKGAETERNPNHESRLPTVLKILVAVFAVVSVIQLVPLPAKLVRFIAPGTYAAWSALAGEIPALGAQGHQRTLSLAPALSFDEAVKYAFFALFAWLVLKRVRTRKDIEIFSLVLILGGALQSLYGLAEVFGGTERIFAYKKIFYLGSATGTFINKNHFSGFLEMLFPLSLGFLLAKADFFGFRRGRTFKEKILWFGQERFQRSVVFGLIPVVIGLGIVFSRSRTGILILFITVFLMFIILSASGGRGEFRPQEERRKRVVAVLRTVLLVILFSTVLIGVRPAIERFSWSKIENEVRPVYFRNTAEMIAHYPLGGTGLATFRYAYPRFEKTNHPNLVDHAHNDYLEILAESGIVGGGCLILAALGTAAVLFARWTKRRDPMARGLLLGSLLGIVALLVHSLMDFNLRIPANAVYFLTFYALAIGLSLKNERGRSGSDGAACLRRRDKDMALCSPSGSEAL